MSSTGPTEIRRTRVHPLRRAALLVSRAVSFLVYGYLVVVEIILLLGFLLLLAGANSDSSFVEWVYRSLDRTMRPFRGIFEPIQLGVTNGDVQSVFETSVLFAMIVYGIVAIMAHSLLDWLNRRAERMDLDDQEYQRQQLVTQTLAAGAQQPVAARAATADEMYPSVPSTPPPPPPAAGPT